MIKTRKDTNQLIKLICGEHMRFSNQQRNSPIQHKTIRISENHHKKWLIKSKDHSKSATKMKKYYVNMSLNLQAERWIY